MPHIGTHDGRTIRYPDPEIKVGHSRAAFAVFMSSRGMRCGEVANLRSGNWGTSVGTLAHVRMPARRSHC